MCDKKNRQSMTASELMANLRQDPAYVAQEIKIEDRERANRERYQRYAAPLIEELVLNGFQIESVGELRHKQMNYERAIPILVKWIPKITDPNVKEDIVRTLSIKSTPPEVALLLIKEFHQTKDYNLRWAIGNAIEVIADDRSLEEILNIVRESKFGGTRQMFVRSLVKWNTPSVIRVLKLLLSDQKEVSIPAMEVLGKFGDQESREALEPLTRHSDLQIRQAARKALRVDSR